MKLEKKKENEPGKPEVIWNTKNLFYDKNDGKLIETKTFASMSAGAKFKMSNINFHTGRSFGIVGQWAVFFASLICASLPITGFLIWWNKRKVKTA